MQFQVWRCGGWVARHQAARSRCRQALASRRSRCTECAAGTRAEPTGRPCTTDSQRRVPAWKRRIWRLQYAAARASVRRAESDFVVTAVVVEVVVVPLVVSPAPPDFPAAAAAVVMPTNASRSPQARMERRNAYPLVVDCKSEAERAGIRPWRAPLGAAYAIVAPRVATGSTLVRR